MSASCIALLSVFQGVESVQLKEGIILLIAHAFDLPLLLNQEQALERALQIAIGKPLGEVLFCIHWVRF